ncbi:hypothetical protein CK203_040293 [Vitis vinifera]|uniref:Uncharacterized protein n=1 Tax=Vitis vinifera TaxID=29760 RepID=A0A438HXH6_VITVI|nr:hypothetical protein CK203_040293 [Vitis vinifera]
MLCDGLDAIPWKFLDPEAIPEEESQGIQAELIDLSEPSSEPPLEPQSSQPPPTESQIPSGMTPEVLIRRPMVTQPPIEARAQGLLPSATEVPYGAFADS